MVSVLTLLVRAYQLVISPLLPPDQRLLDLGFRLGPGRARESVR